MFVLQVTKIQDENDSLQGKHSKYAEQLQNEDINLPNNLDVRTLTGSLSRTVAHSLGTYNEML